MCSGGSNEPFRGEPSCPSASSSVVSASGNVLLLAVLVGRFSSAGSAFSGAASAGCVDAAGVVAGLAAERVRGGFFGGCGCWSRMWRFGFQALCRVMCFLRASIWRGDDSCVWDFEGRYVCWSSLLFSR